MPNIISDDLVRDFIVENMTVDNTLKAKKLEIEDFVVANGLNTITIADLTVTGDTVLEGTTASQLEVTTGLTSLKGGLTVTGDTALNAKLTVTGDTVLEGTTASQLEVTTGLTSLKGGLTVTGDTALNAKLTVTGDTVLEGTTASQLEVTTGLTSLKGGLTVTGPMIIPTGNKPVIIGTPGQIVIVDNDLYICSSTGEWYIPTTPWKKAILS